MAFTTSWSASYGLSSLWTSQIVNMVEKRDKVCLPSCQERNLKGQEKRQLVKHSGQVKRGRPACEWKFGSYVHWNKKERPGIAPKEDINGAWLCQPYFSAAVRTAKASGTIHMKAKRGFRAKKAGIACYENIKCKRPLGRNKMKNESPAIRPRSGISNL